MVTGCRLNLVKLHIEFCGLQACARNMSWTAEIQTLNCNTWKPTLPFRRHRGRPSPPVPATLLQATLEFLMSEVVDLTLSWCLGILVPGVPDHSGSGGAARDPREEEAVRLWLADQAPTTPHLWEGSLVLFSVPRVASSLSGMVCLCPRDGWSAGVTRRVPGAPGASQQPSGHLSRTTCPAQALCPQRRVFAGRIGS